MAVHLLLLLVLDAVSIPVQVGQIWVAAPVNSSITLDGRPAGVVADGVGGRMITNVPAGRHTVTVRASKGPGVVSRIIEVRALETYQLVVPALSLYKRPGSQSDEGDLRVKSVSRRCIVTIAGTRHEMTSKTLTIGRLAPGFHDLAVLCGHTEMAARIEIKKGHTTLVEVDARVPIIRVVGERPMAGRLTIPLANDGSLPVRWKRVIYSVLDSAIYEFTVQHITGPVVTATFRCASAREAAILNEKLFSQPEVEDLSVTAIEEVSRGVLVRVTITFVTP